ncbi:serine/threonine-protein kinase Sgk2 [Xylaria bambusicola]|uniref:serine/threonine-protein kinase Sgk2 n=1 Tax=Xylaria bambusicola TaxID=326684 RepID=UPI002007A25C|nr:serine/threonine-protein kinase Sgk2 [Xylaria bambusicola]KAI0516702.1 serine/threonine-protein kinase Sgk2 [Xylaria bambusicola]
MADEPRSTIIKDNLIGKGLDSFRTSFNSTCEDKGLSYSQDTLGQLGQEDLRNLALPFLFSLQSLPASGLLVFEDRSWHASKRPPETHFCVYLAVTESTPPPRPIASSIQQTPWLYNTGSFANSSEYRQDVDRVLKLELGPLYVGVPRFRETFFGAVADLQAASELFFKKCMEGNNPCFRGGWTGWPKDANQDDVLCWFAELSEELAAFAEDHKSTPTHRRRPLAQPNKPIKGSTAERKLDIGFVSDQKLEKTLDATGGRSSCRLDLGRYAREVLAAQDTCRFVLGFTLCGSLMRVWLFDRLGGVASERFDINEDGLQFVSTILGFLWMNEEELGFDPTIIIENGQRFIEIERKAQTERLIIDTRIKRIPCVAGWATTCWKAHREDDLRTPLVIKDSWQYTEMDEEGELLREATENGAVNVARYYHHETVYVRGEVDDVRSNVPGGLNIMGAGNYRPGRSIASPSTGVSRKGRSSSNAGLKRASSQTGAPLPPSKRFCSASPTKASTGLPNRVHWRVVLCDYGKPIYKASSRAALLSALEGCIEGHESLRKAGLLHRDISINNLMINEEEENPSWASFLVDLDLAIRKQREGVSGARRKTGTRAFMAIGVLLGEQQHSFMHDLESFFWVLFWICIHYNGPGKDIGPTEFESWNYESDNKLVRSTKGVIDDEEDFLNISDENFTPYYQSLIPWVNRLRKKVFPNGERWKKEDLDLYIKMKETLHEARNDPKVLGTDSIV